MDTAQFKQAETFDANAPLKVDSVKIEWLPDECPDLSWLEQYSEDSADADERKYARQDKARLQSYGSQWEMLGCVAKAQVSYPIGGGSRRLEWLTSGGLWGIESDSDKAYLREVENEQLAELAKHLRQFGIETSTEQLRELTE
jgi:hypothetical protein